MRRFLRHLGGLEAIRVLLNPDVGNGDITETAGRLREEYVKVCLDHPKRAPMRFEVLDGKGRLC